MSEMMLTAEDAENAEAGKDTNELTELVIGAAIEVHRALGPGLLESTYEICLCHELKTREISFERQKPIPIEYKGVHLDCGYRADLIVDGQLLVELKAVDSLLPIHDAQLSSYLKLGGWKCALLINFNVRLLKSGIRRRVLNLSETFPLDTLRPPRSLR
jgi:GxxExxY protein